ncbi:SPFH domain-containing protein [Falsiroseomonas sp.]|uniref:SPFH domain-containing protein n=1 Tax=Falsiroseomonas sp. TaxID=2870721 RepID=UPI003F7189D9
MPEIPLATIILVVIVALAVITVAKGVRTVPQGEVWSVERFGAFTRLLQPGLNLIIPYVDGIGRKLNVQEVVLDIPEQSVITKDNASVAVDGIVYYRVMDPAKAAYAVQDLKQALVAMAMTNIRAVIGEMDLDQTLSSRDRINTSLLTILDGATEAWGAKVSRVEIRKIEPPENLIRAMNLQMTAERERRASVAKAEGEKQALVLQAEGRRDSALRDAEAREALAQAEANATRMVAEAAAGAGADALRYFIAQQYVKAFEALAANPSSKLVVVPMESASLAGGITQAMELLRASPGGPAGTAPPTASAPPPVPPATPTLPGVSPWNRG